MDNINPRPGVGRPAPPGGRRKPRSFKANDVEWDEVKRRAEKEGLNVSDYIRSKVLGEKD